MLSSKAKVLICPECGYIEPWSHEDDLVTCHCGRENPKTFKESLKEAEEHLKKQQRGKYEQ